MIHGKSLKPEWMTRHVHRGTSTLWKSALRCGERAVVIVDVETAPQTWRKAAADG